MLASILCFVSFILLTCFVHSQTKGEALVSLKAGQPLSLPVTMTGPGPNPTSLLVGVWLRWTRCSFVAVEAQAASLDRFDSLRSDVWLAVGRSLHSSTDRRLFNCSVWQHIGLALSVDGAGNTANQWVLQVPETRPPLSWEEHQSLLESRVLKLLLHPTTGRRYLTTHRDLLQYRPYYYLDYTADPAARPAALLLAFADIVAGLSSPLPTVLLTDRYFRAPADLRIFGQPFSGNQLLGFINDYNATSRPGLSLRWNTTYEFPDLIQLPDSVFAVDSCFTLLLSLHVDSHLNDLLQRVAVVVSVRSSAADAVLLRDYELRLNFGTLGGKANGSFWSMSPQDSSGQNLTLVVSVCRLPTTTHIRHRLFRDGSLVVDAVQPPLPSELCPYAGQKLSAVVSASSTVWTGNRVALTEVRVAAGAADSNRTRLTATPPPEGCLVATAVAGAGGAAETYCLKCNTSHFWEAGSCVAQTASGLNTTCSYWAAANSCSSCAPGYKADLYRYECYPNSMPCPFPFYNENPTSNTCSDYNIVSVCSIFSTRDSATNQCQCRVANCQTCSYSPCELCSSGYQLALVGTQAQCISPQLGTGPSNLPFTHSTTEPCMIQDCEECLISSSSCDLCAVGSPYCQPKAIIVCPTDCAKCADTAPYDCLECNSGFYMFPDNSCGATCDTNLGKYISNGLCLSCIENCTSCIGPGAYDCTVCDVDFLLTVQGNCLHKSQVKPYQYEDEQSGYLEYCHPTCQNCSGPGASNCTACYNVYKSNPFTPANGTSFACQYYSCNSTTKKTAATYGGACTVSCPAGVKNCARYNTSLFKSIVCDSGKELNGESDGCITCNLATQILWKGYCYPCHPTCTNCSSPEYNKCLGCKPTIPQKYLMASGDLKDSCVECSSPGMVALAGNICDFCASPCLECYGSPTNCTRCESPLFLDLAQGECVTNCPTGTFVWSGVCVLCDPSCAACDLSPARCTACTAPALLDPLRHLCLSPADLITLNFFEVPVVTPKTALPCSPACKQCLAADRSCSSCHYEDQVYLFADGDCDLCPRTGYYLDGLGCVQCDANCLGCVGHPKNCTFCRPAAYLGSDGVCSPCRTPGFYPEDRLVVPLCLACREDCRTCVDNRTCESCPTDRYLSADRSCGPCDEPRVARVGANCVVCHETCAACDGGSDRDCTECEGDRFLAPTGQCLAKQNLTVVERLWVADLSEVQFVFEREVEWAAGAGKETVEVGLYGDAESTVVETLQGVGTNRSLAVVTTGLKSVPQYEVKDVVITGKILRVKLLLGKTLPSSVLVLKPTISPLLQGKTELGYSFNGSYLQKAGLTLEVSGLDSLLDTASSTVSNSVTVFTTLLFIISIPQAFVLMKVFQTIDFYIYINCEYPSNFSKLLEIFSRNLMDFVPNSIESLADEEGVPVYPRFEKFGLSIHVFKNLGRHFTFFSCVGLFKLLVMGLTKCFPKVPFAPKINSVLNQEALLSMVEGYHMDIILGVMIHIANRSQIVTNTFSMKYLAILFISLMSLGLVSLYLLMGYVVHKLTKVVRQLGIVDIKDIPDFPLKAWLEDKVIGNFFQRHFNLLMMLKDVWVCSLLITNYENPVSMLILLTVYQTLFFGAVCLWPPYTVRRANVVLLLTQGLYLLLNAAFLCNVTMEWTEKQRYYVVGIWMICIVCTIVIANTYVSASQSIRMLWRRIMTKLGKKSAKVNAGAQSNSQDPTKQADDSHLDLVKRKPLDPRNQIMSQPQSMKFEAKGDFSQMNNNQNILQTLEMVNGQQSNLSMPNDSGVLAINREMPFSSRIMSGGEEKHPELLLDFLTGDKIRKPKIQLVGAPFSSTRPVTLFGSSSGLGVSGQSEMITSQTRSPSKNNSPTALKRKNRLIKPKRTTESLFQITAAPHDAKIEKSVVETDVDLRRDPISETKIIIRQHMRKITDKANNKVQAKLSIGFSQKML